MYQIIQKNYNSCGLSLELKFSKNDWILLWYSLENVLKISLYRLFLNHWVYLLYYKIKRISIFSGVTFFRYSQNNNFNKENDLSPEIKTMDIYIYI